jgi:hypothetical protein
MAGCSYKTWHDWFCMRVRGSEWHAKPSDMLASLHDLSASAPREPFAVVFGFVCLYLRSMVEAGTGVWYIGSGQGCAGMG